jgi:3-oxoacyl-[acyl-carrier-protein] synthase-3
MNQAYIVDIAYYLPSNELSNKELETMFPEWSMDKIEQKTGIKNRHIASKDEFASDLAVKAAERLFENKLINKDGIDFILYCTQSPDYFLPTTACILQERLGLSTKCGALDYNLGCSGYVYGLALSKGLILSGVAKSVLLITSETYSKYININDKVNRTIFGDAASATLVSTEGIAEILDFELGTDGSGAQNLIVKNGASRFSNIIHAEMGEVEHLECSLYMNGPEIFSFTAESVPILIKESLNKNNLKESDINMFIFHQANKFMLEFLKKLTNISDENFFTYYENIGNTVSSTIPIALSEARKQNKLYGNVLIAGFGVGYSWGATILKFQN